jgi:hypothetical protein
MSGHVSGTYISPQTTFGFADGLSFSDTMRSIDTDFSEDSWNFSEIRLELFEPPPVSHVQLTQFNGTTASSEPELPPLPPVEYNPSPTRPRLPAIPPSSPPKEQPQEAQAKSTSKSRWEPIVKHSKAVVPPERLAAAETQVTPSAPTGTANVSKASKSKLNLFPKKVAKSNAKRASTGTLPNTDTELDINDLPSHAISRYSLLKCSQGFGNHGVVSSHPTTARFLSGPSYWYSNLPEDGSCRPISRHTPSHQTALVSALCHACSIRDPHIQVCAY